MRLLGSGVHFTTSLQLWIEAVNVSLCSQPLYGGGKLVEYIKDVSPSLLFLQARELSPPLSWS
jgi:hypothetical protein